MPPNGPKGRAASWPPGPSSTPTPRTDQAGEAVSSLPRGTVTGRRCDHCDGPLLPPRRRFCSDLCRRRGQRAERITENDDYSAAVVRQIRAMGRRASADVEALRWLAGAVEQAHGALALAVDGCRARGYSDAEIGAALGITRQPVWKRFSRQPKVGTGPADSGVAG